MTKTTNYQLNQWEKTDRIMMEDFNTDNAKIDAAIAGRLGPAEIIKTIAIPQAAPYVKVDLSDMDWDKWDMVVIHYDRYISFSKEIYTRVFAKDGNSVTNFGNYGTTGIGYLYSGKALPLFTFFFPLRDKTRKVVSLSVAGSASTGMVDMPFADIKDFEISLASGITLTANSNITVWGLR